LSDIEEFEAEQVYRDPSEDDSWQRLVGACDASNALPSGSVSSEVNEIVASLRGAPAFLTPSEATLELSRLRKEARAADRLRALVARMREVLGEALGAEEECAPGIWGRIESLFADPDGQAASEWLDREREKAAEPWKLLAAHVIVIADGCGDGRPPLPAELEEAADSAKAWLEALFRDAQAKAREEGRAELYEELTLTREARARDREEGRREGLRQAIAAAREKSTFQLSVVDQIHPADWLGRTGHRAAALALNDFANALEARDLSGAAIEGRDR